MKYLVFLVGLVLVAPAVLTIVHSSNEVKARQRLSEFHSFDARSSYTKEKVFETLSFGLLEGAEEIDSRIEALKQTVVTKHRSAVIYSSLTALLATLLLGLSFFLRNRDKACQGLLNKSLLWASSFSLALGLLTPIFIFRKSASYPLLGEVIHHSEIVTIPSAAAKVWDSNPFIAFVIVLFSVVTPMIKIGLSLHLSLGGHFKEKTQKMIMFLSKWSMADVFIVAILLAVLSTSKGEGQFASVGIGFYFFLAYCLLAHLQMYMHLRSDRG